MPANHIEFRYCPCADPECLEHPNPQMTLEVEGRLLPSYEQVLTGCQKDESPEFTYAVTTCSGCQPKKPGSGDSVDSEKSIAGWYCDCNDPKCRAHCKPPDRLEVKGELRPIYGQCIVPGQAGDKPREVCRVITCKKCTPGEPGVDGSVVPPCATEQDVNWSNCGYYLESEPKTVFKSSKERRIVQVHLVQVHMGQ